MSATPPHHITSHHPSLSFGGRSGRFGDMYSYASPQELYRMGILYDSEDKDNCTASKIPSIEQAPPTSFVWRHRKPRRSRRLRALPLHLSLSTISTDAAIARLLSASPATTPTPTIQHREVLPGTTPQSLPSRSPSPSPALESPLLDTQHTHTHSLHHQTATALDDWELITTTPPQSHDEVSTPSSEPETWILLSDDSQQIPPH